MNLEQLKAAGGFVAPEPVKQTVTWEGHTFDLWIRRRSFAEFEKLMVIQAEGVKAQGALMLSTFVLLGDEHEPLSYEDAERLEPSLATVMIEAVRVVAERPKSSPPKTKRGVKSRSPSGEEPSQS